MYDIIGYHNIVYVRSCMTLLVIIIKCGHGITLLVCNVLLNSFTQLLVCFWVLKMDSKDIRMVKIKP